MSIATDGIICYGILLEEFIELPWNAEIYEKDEMEWWLHVNNFKIDINPSAEDYWGAYFEQRDAFLEDHPLPFKVVNVCHIDNPIYILAIPGTVRSANRGYPTSLQDGLFPHIYVDKEKIKILEEFCQKYDIEYDNDAKGWWLGSYSDF